MSPNSGDKALYERVAPLLDIMGKVVRNLSYLTNSLVKIAATSHLPACIFYFHVVKILSWGSRKWSCNEACCQHDHGKVLSHILSLNCYLVLQSVSILQKFCIYFSKYLYCSMMASFSEGLLLSEKVGLDPSILVQVFPRIVVL